MSTRDPLDLLVPQPRKVERRAGAFVLDEPFELRVSPGFASPALERLRATLAGSTAIATGSRAIEVVLDKRSGHPREGYELVIEPARVRLAASQRPGLDHGLRTLRVLVIHYSSAAATARRFQRPGSLALPALAIEDAPVFERRGVMLDVSRDRVPRMDYLFALVEQLAEWKLNELQLYFEHAFAYREHERIWRGVDPFTREEIRALDAHCAAHGIELVPNQQSFGHLHHWLKHPEYRHLAEVPEGIVHPFLGAGVTTPEPFSLCPTDPRSLEFLAGLYDELLPCFTSGDFNVGLDETIDLGPGRSAEACRTKGVGRVYLEFLQSVHGLVRERGKRMQFWADILLHYPELVPEVPKDAVAMLWGYEADHPFERETETLAEAGLPFYVCPGTSSWQSIGGRIDNMLANVRSAAHWGAARGAKGLLITDWGDRGHLQPPSISWPGFITAAGLAWNPDAPRVDADESWWASLLGHNGLAVMGKAAIDLGRAPLACGAPVRNASALSVLLTKFDQAFPTPELVALTAEGLQRARALTETREVRFLAKAEAHERTRVRAGELRWASALMRFACDLGSTRLAVGDGRPLNELEKQRRLALASELEPLITEHRSLWLERSRPAGLDRSARWLERILDALRAR